MDTNFKFIENEHSNEFLLKVNIREYHDGHIVKFMTKSGYVDKEDEDDSYEDEYSIDTRFDEYMKEYIKDLINNKVLEDDRIYNLYDINFIERVNEYKKKINLAISSKHSKELNRNWRIRFYNMIVILFHNNTIINNKYYACQIMSKVNNKPYLYIGECSINLCINYIKIRENLYDSDYLREYLPYIIEANDNNEYYIINRDYEYIELNAKYIDKPNNTNWVRTYLFNDNTKPWIDIESFNKYIISLKDLVKNKRCLNMDKNTAEILEL